MNKSIFLAIVIFILVIIVGYIAIGLYETASGGSTERFWSKFHYRPSCSGSWLWQRRGACRGLTTGRMPAIDDDGPNYWSNWITCGGRLGVPP